MRSILNNIIIKYQLGKLKIIQLYWYLWNISSICQIRLYILTDIRNTPTYEFEYNEVCDKTREKVSFQLKGPYTYIFF